MFSNGTEYHAFLEHECGDCPHFVNWQDAPEERRLCPVEERIAMAAWVRNFPFEWLDENNDVYRYDCRKKAGLEPKGPMTDGEADQANPGN